jgi:hypothetical protein
MTSSQDVIDRGFSAAVDSILSGSFELFIEDSADVSPNGPFTLTSLEVTLNCAETPLPAALPLFYTGLGVMGLLGWRRKRKNAGVIASA